VLQVFGKDAYQQMSSLLLGSISMQKY
ncbi:MAG: hypothetical protein JWM30_2150, partial [Burkholderia sp.]|nr:hypothetical protein [Burkholderia sp.]